MTNPVAGDVIASRWVVVILGGKKPCVVEFASNTAELLAAEVAPTTNFPLIIVFVKVPTLVKLEFVTVEFKVVPDKVPASAVIVISLLPSNATLFIFLAIANFVDMLDVEALVAVVANVAVKALPVILNLVNKAEST
jgi:hypothetical protein